MVEPIDPAGTPPLDPPVARPKTTGDSLSRQAGIIIVARALAFLVSFAVPMILVRVITDQAQYGHYRQAIFLLSIAYPILQFGMTQSLYYFYPRERERRPGLLTQTVAFLAVTGICFAVLFTAMRELVGEYFNEPVMADYAPIVGPYVMLMVIASIIDTLPIVQQKMRLTFWVIIGSETLRAVLLVAAAVLTRDVRVMLLALLVFSAARAFFLLGLLRYQRLLGIGTLRRDMFRTQLAYSVPFGLAGTVVTVIMMADRLYLGRYVDSTQFAIYSIGSFQLPVIMIVFQSTVSVLLGRMAELQGQGRTAEMAALLNNAVGKLSLVALPAVAVTLVLARDIITVVFTAEYAEATPIFMIFLALIPRSATTYGTIPRAYGLTRWIFGLSLVSLVVALSLVFYLTPRLGLIGPAIAVVTALWVMAAGQIWKSGQLLGTGLRRLYPWWKLTRIAALSAVLALGLVAARAAVPLPPIVRVFGGGMLYVIVYVLLAIMLGLIARSDVAAAWQEVGKRVGLGRR